MLSSVYSAVDKVGKALGGVLFMFFLSLIGFVESADGQIAGQTPEVIRGIGIAYIVAPAVLHVSSILILNRYRLSSADLVEPA